jgi:outer membrane protein assembly factor BamA
VEVKKELQWIWNLSRGSIKLQKIEFTKGHKRLSMFLQRKGNAGLNIF